MKNMRNNYIFEKTRDAYMDFDTATLVKIISYTSRGDSSDNERIEFIK